MDVPKIQLRIEVEVAVKSLAEFSGLLELPR